MFRTGTFFSDYSKDTFYRFDYNKKANWERPQLETAKNVILDIESQTDKDHVNCLIFDDSLYRRTGGKGTDLCARVFDHNEKNAARFSHDDWCVVQWRNLYSFPSEPSDNPQKALDGWQG